jgi:hypothetical protein
MVPTEVALPGRGQGQFPALSWMIGTNNGEEVLLRDRPSESADHTAGTISADGASKELVLITTGPAGANRPSTNLADYVDDSENRDGGIVYITPAPTAYARDRLYTFP